MKRTMLGAIIAIMSVGIGPAMLAGPSAVLADEADDEESEEGAHDPENSGGGGGGGAPVEDLLNLPALDSLRDELGNRITDLPGISMDLPGLKIVGKPGHGDAIRQQVEQEVAHVHKQNCCGDPDELAKELTKARELQVDDVKTLVEPPNLGGIGEKIERPPGVIILESDLENLDRPAIDISKDLSKIRELEVQ